MGVKVTFGPFDAADYLKSEDDIAGYLAAVAEEDDPAAMVVALGAVARARNTSALARQVGVSREGLYRSFSPTGNPSFSTVRKVADALGYQVAFRKTVHGNHSPGAKRERIPAKSAAPTASTTTYKEPRSAGGSDLSQKGGGDRPPNKGKAKRYRGTTL